MTMNTAWQIRRRVTKLQEFAATVGLKLKREVQEDGSIDLVLYQNGEPLCTEPDCIDMEYSIQVYAGSHPDYADAKAQYEYMIK